MTDNEPQTDATVQPWAPAFDGQRPPFEPGHELSMKHGAYSVRKVGPRAEQLVQAVLTDPALAYLHAPAYVPALVGWATAEARAALIAEWIDSMSIEQQMESGQGRTAPIEQLRRWDAAALTHRARLGLDPLSRAKLQLDTAAAGVDIAKLLAEARRLAEGGDLGADG